MSHPGIVLLLILVLGMVGKSSILVASAAILLLIQALHLTRIMGTIQSRALEAGLVLLMVSMLAPFARGEISMKSLFQGLYNLRGLITLIAAIAATRLNLGGLEMLQREPTLMLGIVAGSILGILLLRGIPVGPLMAAGLAWVVIEIWHRILG